MISRHFCTVATAPGGIDAENIRLRAWWRSQSITASSAARKPPMHANDFENVPITMSAWPSRP